MEKWQFDIRCCECGRFCLPADSGVMYGGCTDMEPPEADYFCPRCAQQLLKKAQRTPESITAGCWWHKPNYVSVAKSILRHRR